MEFKTEGGIDARAQKWGGMVAHTQKWGGGPFAAEGHSILHLPLHCVLAPSLTELSTSMQNFSFIAAKIRELWSF